jgi:hypothetical protein
MNQASFIFTVYASITLYEFWKSWAFDTISLQNLLFNIGWPILVIVRTLDLFFPSQGNTKESPNEFQKETEPDPTPESTWKKEFTCEGFIATALHGNELVYFDEDGTENILDISNLAPEKATIPWDYLTALTGSYGTEESQRILQEEYRESQLPIAHRLGILAFAIPLSRNATDAILLRARERKMKIESEREPSTNPTEEKTS